VLVWEGRGLEVQEVGVAEQPVEVEAERVRRQLGVQPGAQPREGLGVMGREAELRGQPVVDRLDDPARR
jgi:hypothetical protein